MPCSPNARTYVLCAETGRYDSNWPGPAPSGYCCGRPDPALGAEALGVVALRARALARKSDEPVDHQGASRRVRRAESDSKEPQRSSAAPAQRHDDERHDHAEAARLSHAPRENEKSTPAPQASSSRNLNGLRT